MSVPGLFPSAALPHPRMCEIQDDRGLWVLFTMSSGPRSVLGAKRSPLCLCGRGSLLPVFSKTERRVWACLKMLVQRPRPSPVSPRRQGGNRGSRPHARAPRWRSRPQSLAADVAVHLGVDRDVQSGCPAENQATPRRTSKDGQHPGATSLKTGVF